MTELLRSGHDRLDAILGGGLPASAINLVIGLPGTGKTILAQQYVFANASEERPAIYFSTVSEPFDKILRYGQRLEFFDPQAVGKAVFYEDLGERLFQAGLASIPDALADALKARSPGIVVIDSFKGLSAFASSAEEFRRFLHEVTTTFASVPTSAFWVGEYGAPEIGEAPEFAVADTILSLSIVPTGEREARYFEVMKMRGRNYLSGRHAYRLSAQGMEVYPRLADPGRTEKEATGAAGSEPARSRVSSGIPTLDELIADGYREGSSTFVAGPAGSGKTLIGLQFALAASRDGDRALIATFQERPSQLEQVANGFDWSLRDSKVQILYRSPVDLYVDQWVYELLDLAEKIEARRIVIDSLTDLEFASRDPVRHREYLYSLVQRCSRNGISLLMTSELPRLFTIDRLSSAGVSHIADNVLVLQYLRDGGIKRGLTVLKSRATRHRPQTYEFEIDQRGVTIDIDGRLAVGDQWPGDGPAAVDEVAGA